MLNNIWQRYCVTRPFFMAFVLGHVAAYGMGPFYQAIAVLMSLSLFWILWTDTAVASHPRRAIATIFFYAFGFFVSSLWWIGNALLVGGNENFLWAYPLAVCGLPVLLSLFPTIVFAIFYRLTRRRDCLSYLVFITVFFMAEVARGHLLSGFPWNFIGMTWTNTLPMLQILSVGGIYSLTALSIFWFTLPAFVVMGTSPKILRALVGGIGALSAIGVYGFGYERLQNNPTTYNNDVVIQMIQPNIAQEDKWNPEKRWDNLRSTLDLIEPFEKFPSAKTRAVIMPETTLTFHELQTPQAMEALRNRLHSYNEKTVYLLTGALLQDDKGYHNSLIVMDKTTTIKDSFDKFHLVPFGEYIPLQRYIPIPTVTSFSGFVAGDGPRTLTHENLPPFSPLVCYEVIFPHRVINPHPPRPAWMVNVTNDAWYGISPGPFQHLAHAQYRAIEEGVPMVRVAGTGISAIIDPYGRIVAQMGLGQKGNLEFLLPTPSNPL